jgi:hypothetical protein
MPRIYFLLRYTLPFYQKTSLLTRFLTPQPPGQVFGVLCLQELWPEYGLWLPYDEAGKGWERRYSLRLEDSFTEVLESITLNGDMRLTPAGDGVKSQQSCWFLARRCKAAADQPWVGKVMKIYRYRSPMSPDINSSHDILLEVEWHAPILDQHSQVVLDKGMNVPLVAAAAASQSEVQTRYWLAQGVAPVRVLVEPHPTNKRQMCVLSESFSFMRVAGWEPLSPVIPALCS